MAEVLVSALTQTLIGNLNKALLRGVKLLWGLEDDLRRLESVFSTIQLVLQDAEVKQRNNLVLQNWLLKLKDVAYDAEDVLDLIATKELRRRFNSERGKHEHLTSFFSKRNPLLFRVEIARKVKDIVGRLNDLADERHKFHLMEGVVNNQVGVVESRQTSSLVNESEICGRDEEREMLVQKLLHDMADRDDLSVCAVWGMGGIGKTTLTQLVYNDERVENHFELRIWVCVSEDFSLPRLVKAILEDVQGCGCSLTELNPLVRELQDKLRGKKFLLVLDDVWNENQSLWDPLKEALRCGSKGSGVMVTTRNENIARMMATDETMSHRIGYLSNADSWSLFKRRAFACGTEDENLVGIGKEIVKKCGGVPLAIKAVGSLMRSKSHESEWLAVKESETWNLPGHGNDIFPVLMLSYDNLSPQMRQCFSYCCVFPKDYWMDRDELIRIWMANGFLHEEGQKDLYLIGQLIFKELVWRSFLQDVEKHRIGKMRCKMHDLMHDLAESVMRQETYKLVGDMNVQKIPPRVRHLSCQSLGMIKEKRDKRQLLNVDTLHSLIHLGYSAISYKFSFSFLSNQQHLRVLNMRFCRTKELPKFFHKWEHLRFLSMSCSELTTLPESITRLHNLQTLKLEDTDRLRKLPEGLKYMKNLWFVEMDFHPSLICTPPGIGELTSLQGLSVFIVGEDSAHQISQLKELNLGGELSIRGLENVRNLKDAKDANMITKLNLASLNLSWTSGANNKISMENFEATLEGIQPHHNLEQISILSYQGSRFPNWMSAPAFINLSEITLERCDKCEHLPPLGKLPALKVLKLVGLDSIRRLGGEWCGDGESSFVALTHLSISKMPNLEEWIIPNSHESFLRLQYLDIDRCPKLIRQPFLPVLKELVLAYYNPVILGSMMATSIESLCLSGDEDELSLLPGGLVSAQKNLKELQIKECRNLRSLSIMLDDLYALKKLDFNCCKKLEYPPEGLKFLNSLEELRFYICDSLRLFPAAILENMPSLRSLSFIGCEKLLDPLSGPLQRIVTSLHELVIFECPELKCLPESIQQLSASLRELRIEFCSGLCSLPDWIGNLQSLSTFRLFGCRNLTSLPDGFQNLKLLSVLDMRGCSPILAKRCEKSKGEDWPKISHIPKIYIF